jgi:hypothetical protein
LTQKAQKKKLGKKKTLLRKFRSCASDQGSAFGIRKLFEKSLIKNFLT